MSCFILYFFNAWCGQQHQGILQPQGPVTIIVTNNNDNNNKTNVQTAVTSTPEKPKPEKPYKRCLSLSGQKLVDCMACLSHQDFNKALLKMNVRQRDYYVDYLKDSRAALQKLKRDCTAQTWTSLQAQDPTCISKIEREIQTHDKQGKDSAQGILVALITCFMIAIGAG